MSGFFLVFSRWLEDLFLEILFGRKHANASLQSFVKTRNLEATSKWMEEKIDKGAQSRVETGETYKIKIILLQLPAVVCWLLTRMAFNNVSAVLRVGESDWGSSGMYALMI